MDKKLMSIGEVAEVVGVSTHTLRRWEKEFPFLKPIKHKGRRFYDPQLVELILKIKQLLDRGMTVDAVKRRLMEGISDEEKGFLRILAGLKEEVKGILEYMDACERERYKKGL